MQAFVIFMVEVLLCLTISVVVIRLLRPLLLDVLTDTCGTRKRAAFWVMFTQLMLVISPLLIVIYFTPVGASVTLDPVLVLKDTLFRTLLGEFIGLAMVGQIIWKSIQAINNKETDENDLSGREDPVTP